MILRPFALFCLLSLAACGLPGTAPRSQEPVPDFPALVPLAPVERDVEAILARDAASDGASLQDRGADLRRRAALLRDIAL